MHMGILLAITYLHHVRLRRSEESLRAPGVTDGCELLGRHWEPKLGLLEL